MLNQTSVGSTTPYRQTPLPSNKKTETRLFQSKVSFNNFNDNECKNKLQSISQRLEKVKNVLSRQNNPELEYIKSATFNTIDFIKNYLLNKNSTEPKDLEFHITELLLITEDYENLIACMEIYSNCKQHFLNTMNDYETSNKELPEKLNQYNGLRNFDYAKVFTRHFQDNTLKEVLEKLQKFQKNFFNAVNIVRISSCNMPTNNSYYRSRLTEIKKITIEASTKEKELIYSSYYNMAQPIERQINKLKTIVDKLYPKYYQEAMDADNTINTTLNTLKNLGLYDTDEDKKIFFNNNIQPLTSIQECTAFMRNNLKAGQEALRNLKEQLKVYASLQDC